jgi:hypothetical protein
VTAAPEPSSGSRILIALAWPVAVVFAVIAASGAALIIVAFIEAPSEAVHTLATVIARGQVFSRMVALLVIVPAIFGLAIVGKVDGAAAIAALSAIAGYVLGSVSGN